MGMSATQSRWTASAAMALPDDGNRYEVLNGELVVTPAPSWRHQAAVELLAPLLRAYVRQCGLGWVKHAPADVSFATDMLVQPDIFVVPHRDGGPKSDWSAVTELLLVIEVCSPSTAHVDRGAKRVLYQSHGIPEYWIVDVEARRIERWVPSAQSADVVADTLHWQPRDDVSALEIDLVRLFDDIER